MNEVINKIVSRIQKSTGWSNVSGKIENGKFEFKGWTDDGQHYYFLTLAVSPYGIVREISGRMRHVGITIEELNTLKAEMKKSLNA